MVRVRESGSPWKVFDCKTSTLLALPATSIGSCEAKAGQCTIPGLLIEKQYEAMLRAKNSIGWGDWSPTAKLTLSAHLPVAPCAPTLEPVSEDSIRVRYAAPPGCASVLVRVREPGSPWKVFDCKTSTLRSLPAKSIGTCEANAGQCTIPGLLTQRTYEVMLKAKNSIGWGDYSPTAKLTLSEPDTVEEVGCCSWSERDAELRKQAVDVDDDGEVAPPTQNKRAANFIDLETNTMHGSNLAKRVRSSALDLELRRIA